MRFKHPLPIIDCQQKWMTIASQAHNLFKSSKGLTLPTDLGPGLGPELGPEPELDNIDFTNLSEIIFISY